MVTNTNPTIGHQHWSNNGSIQVTNIGFRGNINISNIGRLYRTNTGSVLDPNIGLQYWTNIGSQHLSNNVNQNKPDYGPPNWYNNVSITVTNIGFRDNLSISNIGRLYQSNTGYNKYLTNIGSQQSSNIINQYKPDYWPPTLIQ